MIRFLEPLANPWKVEQQWQVPFTALSLFFWLVKDFSSTISKECSNFWVQHHRCSTKFNKWYQLGHLSYEMGKSTLHCSLCRELARCVSAIQIAASKYRLGGTPKGANSGIWYDTWYLNYSPIALYTMSAQFTRLYVSSQCFNQQNFETWILLKISSRQFWYQIQPNWSN